MPDIPEEAVALAADAITLAANHFDAGETGTSARRFARAALEAAASLLAEATLTPLAKRHAMIPSEWGGGYCGTCWTKGGSRAAWPCGEILAIAEILPARAGIVSSSSAPTGETGEP